MKPIYAAMFALFPLSAPAQTPDALLLSALCSDDYYEDTAGQCRAGEVLNILDLLEKYNAVVNCDANHDEVGRCSPFRYSRGHAGRFDCSPN